jgi:hypothetical protein
MSITRRGKLAAGAVSLLVFGTLGYFTLFPENAPAVIRTAMDRMGLAHASAPDPPPATCPLTGTNAPKGAIPPRPALAIKVENHPLARPQAGLNDADIVYEEPVEGGLTRFIAVFQCSSSARVGPVRSGRTTDPNVLRQFGPAIFGYAGGVPIVKREVPRAGLTDVNYIIAPSAYTRDPARAAPHNLYTSTVALRKAAASDAGAPSPVFSYSLELSQKSRRAREVHLPFSGYSDVYWRWSARSSAWLRWHGTVPHTVEGDEQVSATNIVVQVVGVSASSIIDAAGNPSPEVDLVGTGKAYVFRDGRVITGRWERPTLDDLTRFVTRDGVEVALAPGRTWVELLPDGVPVEIG